jgi:hypothetical protein
MPKKLKPGEQVQRNTPRGKTTGTVKKKLTSASKIKGHVAKASRENPKYLVQSEKSGKQAAISPPSSQDAHTQVS